MCAHNLALQMILIGSFKLLDSVETLRRRDWDYICICRRREGGFEGSFEGGFEGSFEGGFEGSSATMNNGRMCSSLAPSLLANCHCAEDENVDLRF